MLLAIDKLFETHQPPGRGDEVSHPESPRRLSAILAAIRDAGDLRYEAVQTSPPVDDATLMRVHPETHLRRIGELADTGGGWIDVDTYVGGESDRVARMVSGTLCDLVDRVLSGKHPTGMLLSRPPGHHATADQAMGFCLYNHIAVAASHALQNDGIEKVLIVDFDVHHGNGTQDIFYRDDRVGFFSMHRENFYPHTGTREQTGDGAGAGWNQNLPIPSGMPLNQQMQLFSESLRGFAESVQPDLVLCSAGFDAHHRDPVGNLGWTESEFNFVARLISEISGQYAAGRWVSVLEGGYDPATLAQCVVDYLRVKQGTET